MLMNFMVEHVVMIVGLQHIAFVKPSCERIRLTDRTAPLVADNMVAAWLQLLPRLSARLCLLFATSVTQCTFACRLYTAQ